VESSNSGTRSSDNRNVSNVRADAKNKQWIDISRLDAPLVITIFAILAVCYFVGRSLAL